MNKSKRLFCASLSLGLLSAGVTLTMGGSVEAKANPGKKRVIPVKAQKFLYTPNRIEARVGETIILAFSAQDFTHGFNLPDFNLRKDLVPGKVINVELMLDRAGEYDFLCDNFCGDGHEGMNGKLIVKG